MPLSSPLQWPWRGCFLHAKCVTEQGKGGFDQTFLAEGKQALLVCSRNVHGRQCVQEARCTATACREQGAREERRRAEPLRGVPSAGGGKTGFADELVQPVVWLRRVGGALDGCVQSQRFPATAFRMEPRL